MGIVRELRQLGWRVKCVVEEFPDGTDDSRISRVAKRERRVVLTRDRDFWDDKLTSFRETGGVVYVDTNSERGIARAIANCSDLLRLLSTKDWVGLKIRITATGFEARRAAGWRREWRYINGVPVEVPNETPQR